MKFRGLSTPDIKTLKMLSASTRYGATANGILLEIARSMQLLEMIGQYNLKDFASSSSLSRYDFRSGGRRLDIWLSNGEPRVRFQLTEYHGWDKVERILKLLGTSKENFNHIADRCVHKVIGGKFKMKEDDYINQLLAQSFKNRMTKESS